MKSMDNKINFYSINNELLFYGETIKEIIENGFGEFTGQGKLYSCGIMVEKGEYKKGELKGQGKKYADGKLIEEGIYIDNELNDYGKRYLDNFILQEGNYLNDELNGYGKTYIRGELYSEGIFEDGQLNGQGKKYINGYVFEEGAFKDGLLIVDNGNNLKDENINIVKIVEKNLQKEVKCPKCSSTQITPITKGFGLGKAAVGGLLLGPIGLLGGVVGSKNIKLICLSCGFKWDL